MARDFGKIGFAGTLRPSQVASSSVIKRQLASGEREILIVAPPGSGKTVLGLYVWSDLVRLPALVLSPNSAIQSQWTARARELFDLDGKEDQVVIDPANPGILTSLTYQSITMPKRGDKNLDAAAYELWIERLIAAAEAEDFTTAQAWINGLRESNKSYYSERLGFYRKLVRDDFAAHGNALWGLHESARKNLDRLIKAGVGLIILDECHHLLQHWGRVLTEVRELFDNPVVLGLTATPPDLDAADPDDAIRYMEFFGEVDYEVPVPALVRDGNLSPYQDLAYFVRPSMAELEYIASVDDQFAQLVADLRRGPPADNIEPARTPGLDAWLVEVLGERRLPTGTAKDWLTFRRRDQTLANAARLHLTRAGIELPRDVPPPEPLLLSQNWTDNAVIIPILDRYVRHGLLRSKRTEDHGLAEEAIQRLRLLGTQITETGMRPCASPVGRVMAYASAKYGALKEILTAEIGALGDEIRVVVITDFEKTSATAIVKGVLDDDAGGAVAAFRAILQDDTTDRLDPVLMTGSTVLVDDDLFERIMPRFQKWIDERNLKIDLDHVDRDGYHEIRGRGAQWQPRYYTEMITELFQQGVTRCLVGTRGLLGEGWDASRINVLIDLTTVTTSMSINQLRGRSFRLDKYWPEKVANNWDIVCLAEEFSRGFDDYYRFIRKHLQLYGVCDDGVIEKGVGHVHAAFTEVRPEGISDSLEVFNAEMLARAAGRQHARALWKIGEPFLAVPQEAIECHPSPGFGGGFPPVTRLGAAEWSTESLVLSIADTVAGSLREIGELPRDAKVVGGNRGGGWLRLYLDNADEPQSKIFIEAMQEVLGPMDDPRYMIPREVKVITDTWASKLMHKIFGRFSGQLFKRKTRVLAMYHAVPKLLARNKDVAAIFQKHWNWRVSPGQVIYCYSDAGRAKVYNAVQRGLSPSGKFHHKSIFTTTA